MIDGLVKELLENFDFKKPILDVMQMQCKEYLINNKNKYGRY